MVDRDEHVRSVVARLRYNPVVAILGARQVGKTTLARLVGDSLLQDERVDVVHRFDLENPRDIARLGDPMLALERLDGLVVLDEIQLRPDIFSVLRVLADQPGSRRFLVLGSASPELLLQGAETLAGRIAFHRLPGFDLAEVGAERWRQLWRRGGFPRSFLAPDEAESAAWRRDFVSTFVQRDLPALGLPLTGTAGRRFWTMLAHGHGANWNGSELGRAFGVSDKTVRGYLDQLTGALVVRQLQPWHANIKKRQVKSPRIYIEDSGLLHTLLGIETREALERHPKVGASWEGFALQQVVARLGARRDQCFFWSTHSGAELDLLVVRDGVRRGFEFKRTSAPKRTRSMAIARRDLELDSLDVVYPGEHVFPLSDDIRAVGIDAIEAL